MLKYTVEKMKFSEIATCVEIPLFQRGLVWDQERKKEFISALKAGWPIGALLFSKKGNDKYLVIDGLQRYTTMRDYSKNPFKYLTDEEIKAADAMGIILVSKSAREIYYQSVDSAKEEYIRKIREMIIAAIKGGNPNDLLQISSNATDSICHMSLFQNEDWRSIQEKTYNIVNAFAQYASINDIELPIIVFTGTADELATIYQNLNQKGVKLSKYDVYAATWINHSVTVANDPEFIKRVIRKYEKASEESHLTISDFDPDEMLISGKLSVFEYAFGLGKELADKCKYLFPDKKDDSKIDGVSFLILAELFDLDFFSIGNLAERIEEYKQSLDFKALKDAIVGICIDIETELKTYITAPTKKGPSLACHADFQLASYVVVLFKLKYTLSKTEGIKPRLGTSREIKDIMRFLHKHYLYDILRNYWSSTGNIKLEDLLRNPETCRYTGDIQKDSFLQVITDWLQTGNDRPSFAVSTEAKLFWNYHLRFSVNSAEIASRNFDIEHCVPQGILVSVFGRNSNLPISSPCNLTFIPGGDNRSKADKTYYQKKDLNPTAFSLNEEKLNIYLYPIRSELRFVESRETITIDNYKRFLKDRITTITRRIIDELYPE